MSRVWPVSTLFDTWDRCLFILVDSRLKIGLEKKSRQIKAESSDFILNPEFYPTRILLNSRP